MNHVKKMIFGTIFLNPKSLICALFLKQRLEIFFFSLILPRNSKNLPNRNKVVILIQSQIHRESLGLGRPLTPPLLASRFWSINVALYLHHVGKKWWLKLAISC